MGKGPVLAPELAGERVGVGQADAADIGLADMADDVLGLDRVLLDQTGDGGAVAGVGVVKAAQAFAFIEGDAPAIPVRANLAAAAHQAGKAEADVGRDIGAHAEQFAHRGLLAVFRGWSVMVALGRAKLEVRSLKLEVVVLCGLLDCVRGEGYVVWRPRHVVALRDIRSPAVVACLV